MCGIGFRLGKGLAVPGNGVDGGLGRRGPDEQGSASFTPWRGEWHAHAEAAALRVRGASPCPQPCVSDDWIFLWNGEAYCFDGGAYAIPDDECDTRVLFDRLNAAKGRVQDWCECEATVHGLLNGVNGEFAFVAANTQCGCVLYGRDRLGRRSLLRRVVDGAIDIRSVLQDAVAAQEQPQVTYEEVPADGIHHIRFDDSDNATETVLEWTANGTTQLYLPSHSASRRLLGPSETLPTEAFLARLETSFRTVLVGTIPSIAILFSGGVDSVAMAAMAARVLPHGTPVHLRNVAFCHGDPEAVPDRVWARRALAELQRLYPQAEWVFEARDVSRAEYDAAVPRVMRAIAPCSTVMDLSIGIALWFAALSADQGDAKVPMHYPTMNPPSLCIPQCIETAATKPTLGPKIVLVGVGADEQLGGYTRHRQVYTEHGFDGVAAEMDAHLRRIAHRNLGRDDRVVSDCGVEARFPFLEEGLVAFLGEMGVDAKCDPRLPRGVGEKRVLREALVALGFSEAVARRPKSAIQFGSRSSRLQDSDSRGTDALGVHS